MARNHLLLIDAHSLIHRCYHAVPPLTNSREEPVGALFGVSNVLLKIVSRDSITHIAALFDRPEPTLRKQKFADYKIQRPKAPDELTFQLNESLELFRAFGIKTFEKIGYEGDDLIGTLAEKFRALPNTRITILTGDMDSLQLVDNKNEIEVETFKKGIADIIVYHEKEVFDRLGVRPDQVVDYKALVGDASDNIPGVAGIGPKTASAILQKYETLEKYLAQGQNDKAYKKISKHKKDALLSQELARIDTHVPVEVSLDDLRCKKNTPALLAFFQKHNFVSLIKRIDIQAHDKNIDESKRENSELVKTNSATPNHLPLIPNHSSLELIKIALQLLGFADAPWESYARLLFKQELLYDEFIQKASAWTQNKIEKEGLAYVYHEIELPLIPIIKKMQNQGVLIDATQLQGLERTLQKELDAQEKILEEKTETVINFNSPKQVLELLQEIPNLKIKSTSADTLEKLKHKIPWIPDLLEYRELFKLQTTYVIALQKLIAKDSRIHPTFLQLGATTGRMSCQNPNLQNIPQESRWSKDIRDAFVAPRGHSLVAIDYSQIELRVLASLAQDKNMIQAFEEGKDIHTITAQKIFNKPEHQITKHMRRDAKTLNFGMVYGMGFRALAQQTSISNDGAKLFIKKYFEEFSAIKRWQEEIITRVKKTGRVVSPTGRFRTLPHINSHNEFFASQARREAINMPTQGLAADILKLAMIRVDAYVRKNNFAQKVRMILTIHDELIFEIDDELIAEGAQSMLIKDLRHEMEQALPIHPATKKTPLLVPLKTEVSIGKRWGELR